MKGSGLSPGFALPAKTTTTSCAAKRHSSSAHACWPLRRCTSCPAPIANGSKPTAGGLLTHSLIGAGLPEQQAAPAAFHAGLARGLAAPAVLPQLFETRAAHLLGALAREQVSEYLSGLLIGAEVASMRAFIADEQAIAIVAGPSLSARYQQAFQLLGRQVTTVSGDDAFLAGIRGIVHAVANLTSADRYSARHHP